MGRKLKRHIMKKLHKWPALVISVFVILWAISGIILNHRHIVAHLDVDRGYLPAEHRYQDWNNAAIKGSLIIDSVSTWYYGNVGLWQHNENSDSWQDRRSGLPSGADHHKINCLLKTGDAAYYCGSRFGLYKYNPVAEEWQLLEIPHEDKHVVDLAEIRDSLWVMTRSHMWKMPLKGEPDFSYAALPPPQAYDNKVGLFKTLWVIHSGEIYGLAGKLLVDFVALIFVFLTLSGLIYFFFPRMIRKRKRKEKKVVALGRWNRFSIKWHNKLGIWLAAILLLTAFTGIFLRPPLLIAIAESRVGKIPFSVLDDGNPWYDQLRRILHDEKNDQLLIATSNGIFRCPSSLDQEMKPIYPQPPASVMGYNVFEFTAEGHILVGSFTGLYLWDHMNGYIYDHIEGKPYVPVQGLVMPIGAYMVSGYHIDEHGHSWVFDYNHGVNGLRHDQSFPSMPEVISTANMPLWNVALEMHTARLLKPIIGDFYILFIPLFGLSVILILISGIVLWYRKYKRKRKNP